MHTLYNSITNDNLSFIYFFENLFGNSQTNLEYMLHISVNFDLRKLCQNPITTYFLLQNMGRIIAYPNLHYVLNL